MIYPNALKQGDTVMIIAPSGPPTIENVLKGVNVLQEMGLSVIIGKSVYEKYGFLAGSDQVRLDDIHEAFTNNEVKAVFCARGGYGSARLLPHIQYEIIRQNPKIFWGYSDITALHNAFSRYAKLITFHGPMIEELGKGIDSLSLSSFNQLFHPYSTILSASECIVSSSHSTVTGTLVGGNLAVLTSIIGSPYEINTDNTLLLLEDIGEEPYRIDRMLNQLLLSGKFNECRGVIFTSCHDCTPSKPSQSLQTILYEYFTPYAIPVLFGLPIGHISPNIGIPLGATATISTHNKTLSISSGVATPCSN
ncbi:LD-carboxypeptidase [Bacillus cereus]|uniref:Murein peptide carboxypeptidase YkfA n=3 Tax=Bacillus cereus group TaxID=86661 RepID=A0A9X5N608_BACTU|nr:MULTISPECIES: LD-carboxypeptidase [Bacillus]MDM5374595.1 LD-carboxypeptidase [Bacillus bombysepticus]AHX17563.1 peptidase U61 LD-carboxypeptidase A [Bacillus bombysepticus str. Wang]EEK63110.1 Muramoyltetrapeptide carboxypeptidase [Bacillus cereus 172560W]EKS7873669.1 LD-carboxypeptidase [Bacillus cereus]KAA1805793.1 putative murein peptide carboxypeptidase [Bacillus cereus]